MTSVAEGVRSCGPVLALGRRAGVELPICEQVGLVLEGRGSAYGGSRRAPPPGSELRAPRYHVIAKSAVVGTAEAVIFDMDGVVTDTASVHEAAWTDLFNGYLVDHGQGHRPFGSADYRRHVDGRARVDGVVGFLRSRGIELPLGGPADRPTADTAWGLANRKNGLFLATLERSGVRAFPGSVALLRELRARDRPHGDRHGQPQRGPHPGRRRRG